MNSNGRVQSQLDETAQRAVQAVDLTRTLPLGSSNVHILNGITFNIGRGEWVALTGPSGSGKSTLLGIIAGLDTPTSGRITIDNVDITDMGEGALAGIRNKKIGVVFQSFNLIPSLTAQENVEVPLYVGSRGGDAPRKARQMLELVGLKDRRNHRPNQLSGGEQQRVAIARALVTQPAILVADEPTGNLDSATGTQVLDLFEKLHKELNLTLIVATHDPDVASRANRILHIVDGKLSQLEHTQVAGAIAR